jgi:hypothetical protein
MYLIKKYDKIQKKSPDDKRIKCFRVFHWLCVRVPDYIILIKYCERQLVFLP